jgi:uncharacterized protein (TIGR00369 family)
VGRVLLPASRPPPIRGSISESRITVAEFEDLVEEAAPFAADYDFRVESLERGGAVARLPASERHLRPVGTVSGPAMMALADFTMYAVTLSEVGRVPLAVTTSLNINFLRGPKPGDVVVKGRTLKAGRRLVVLEVDVYSDGVDGPVAHVTGTYSVPPEETEVV